MKIRISNPLRSGISAINTIITLGCFAAPFASAATRTWDGGNVDPASAGQWNVNTFANWDAAIVNGDDLVFGTTNANGWTLTSVGAARTIKSLTFQSGSPAYNIRLSSTVSGGTDQNLTFSSINTGITVELGDTSSHNIGIALGSLVLQGNLTATHNGSGTLTISRPIDDEASSFGLTKQGTGTMILSGANTYNGATQVNAGILTIGNLAAKGTTSGITVGASGIVGLGVANAGSTTHYLAADVVALFNRLSADPALTGNLAGYSMDNASGVAVDTTAATAFVDQGSALTAPNRSLTKLGTGTYRLNQTNTYTGPTIIKGGTLSLGAGLAGGALSLSSAITVESGATFAVSKNGAVVQGTTFSAAPITGDGNFSHTGGTAGTGVTTLNTANSYTGATTISAGTLSVNSIGSVNGGASALGNPSSEANGRIVIGSGDVNGTLEYTGAGNTSDRSIQINSATGATNGGAIILNNGAGTLTFTAPTFNAAYTNSANISRGLTLGGSSGGEVQGVIQDISATNKVGVIKSGIGTWALTNANTYTGTTTVSGGILKLSSANALPGGIAATGGTSALTINGGIVGLTGDFLRAVGTGTAQVQWTDSGGFAAYGGDRTVNLGATAGWTSPSFLSGTQALVLSAADADGTLIWASGLSFAGTVRTIQVNNGSAAVDARITGKLTAGTSSGLNKTGAGTLELTNSTNDYTGATTVSAGTLRLGASDVLPNTTNVTIAAATLNAATTGAETAGILDITGAATINVATGARLVFTGGTPTWAGALTLTGDLDFSGDPTSSLNFGSSSGLTDTQLLAISATGFTNFDLDAEGDLIATAVGGYASWQSANFTAQTADLDHDNDGVRNGVEFFIGGNTNTTGFTPLPTVSPVGGLSVTWTRHPAYTGSYGSGYVVETSATLTGPWATEPNPGPTISFPTANEVKYTFPTPLGTKNFARLKVTGP